MIRSHDRETGTRFRIRDLRTEAIAALSANRLRSITSGLAVFVSAAAVVAVLTVSATVATQVSAEFNAIRATSVRVLPSKDIPPDKKVFPDDAAARIATLPGVVSGGVVVAGDVQVTVSNTNAAGADLEADLIGVDDSVLDATGAIIDGYRIPAAFVTGATIAYLGESLAFRMGVNAPDHDVFDQVVMVDGLVFQVAGVIRSPQRLTEVSNAVVVPLNTALRLRNYEPIDYLMIVETMSGAAGGVGADLPLVLAPERSDPYVVDVPPDPSAFRQRVEDNVQVLVFAMAALSAFVGAISVASAAYSGVSERTGEFGLRRAFGAKPKHVRAQIIAETLVVSIVAGGAGAAFGLGVSLVISRLNSWTTIVDPVPLVAVLPAAGLLGVIAGLLPAHKASRIDPSTALREN